MLWSSRHQIQCGLIKGCIYHTTQHHNLEHQNYKTDEGLFQLCVKQKVCSTDTLFTPLPNPIEIHQVVLEVKKDRIVHTISTLCVHFIHLVKGCNTRCAVNNNYWLLSCSKLHCAYFVY